MKFFNNTVSFKGLCLALILMFSLNFSTSAQLSNAGTDFWMMFLEHVNENNANVSLYITSDSSTSGTVSVPGANWSTNFTVTANDLTVVNIPRANIANTCSDCIEEKAIHITSDERVVVYGHKYYQFRSDASLILPTRTLEKEYYVMSYTPRGTGNGSSQSTSTFGIVAHKDSTIVKITPSQNIVTGVSTVSRTANTPFEIRLDKGEVYYARGARNSSVADLTGTKIEVIDTGATADCRTIAVFSGMTNVSIHTSAAGNCSGTTGWGGIDSRDNLYQQLFPASSWGNNFIVIPHKDRVSYNCRILAKDNSTRVTLLPGTGLPQTINLDELEFEDLFDVRSTLVILSDKPISVAQYQLTARCDGTGAMRNLGDPSMAIINPLEQTLEDITVYSSRFEQITQHSINVLIPTYARNSFRIDGNSVTFSNVPRLGSWSYAQIPVNQGNHRMTADVGFVAIAHGYGNYESYSYAAGANVRDLRSQIRLANSVQNDRQVMCLGDTAVFRGEAEYNVTKWEWFFGDGDSSQAQNPFHVYKDTGVYEVKLYTYKPTFDGCSDYDSTFMTVHVYGKPEARFRTENLCDSSTAFFYNESFYPPGESQQFVRWEFEEDEFMYDDDVSRDYDSAGRYPITLRVTTQQNCVSIFSDSITISPHPVPSFLKDSICFRDALTFTNTSSVSSGTIAEYMWELENGDTLYGFEPEFFFPDAGEFEVTLTTTTDSGCARSFVDTLYKYGEIQAGFSVNDVCLGLNSVFTNTSTKQNGDWTDTTWTTSDGGQFKTWNLTKEFLTEGTKTVTLIVEQNGKCLDTFERDVEIFPLPTPSFTVENFCFGDNTEFTNTSSIPTTDYTVSWNLDQGANQTTDDVAITYNSSGQKTITLTIETDDGCSGSVQDSIYIHQNLILDINADNICDNKTQIIDAVVSLDLDSITQYDWIIDGVNYSSEMINFTPTQIGTVDIELSLTTDMGCEISETASFVVIESPTADFDIADLCQNLEAITVNNSSGPASDPISTFEWVLNNNFLSSNNSPTFTASRVGNNNISLKVVSDFGCEDSTERNFTVHPLPNVSFNSDNFCLGEETNFVSTSNINSGLITTTQWEIDGNIFGDVSVNYTFSDFGSFPIGLLIISDMGCRDSITNSVTIHPLPELDFVFEPTEDCVPFTPTITNNTTIGAGNVSQYEWDWGDGNIEQSFVNNVSHTYPEPGTYNVTVNATSDQGCESFLEIPTPLTAHPRPVAEYSYDPSENISVINSRVSFISSSVNVNSWNWLTSDGFTYSGQSIQHEFIDSGVFNVRLTVENDFGCRDSVAKDLYVNADLFVNLANSFTPNGDLLNDNFGLFGLTQGVIDFDMKIYNRWGQLIYHSTDVNKPWDGTYAGKVVPQGQYLYRIRHTDPKRSKWYNYNGTVMVIP